MNIGQRFIIVSSMTRGAKRCAGWRCARKTNGTDKVSPMHVPRRKKKGSIHSHHRLRDNSAVFDEDVDGGCQTDKIEEFRGNRCETISLFRWFTPTTTTTTTSYQGTGACAGERWWHNTVWVMKTRKPVPDEPFARSGEPPHPSVCYPPPLLYSTH